MRKIHLSVALTIISGSFLFSGCQSIQTKAVDAPEVLAEFEYPADMNFIILPVTFQDEEYPFILDTGSMVTMFDKSFKDKLGKRFLWRNKGKGPEGVTFKIEYYLGHDPHVGPLDLADGRLIRVCDLDKLVASEKRDFQGIISMEFLQKYIVQIDFDNRKVTFFKGNKDIDIFFFLRPKENKHPEWGESIPLKTKLFSNIRYVKGNILNNMEVDFMVDTGWYSLDSLKSRIFDKTYPQKNSNEKSGDVKSSSTGFSGYNIINQIENFSVDSLEYENHVFRRSSESVLGLAFLSRYIVTFDFPNNRMYLKRRKNFEKPLIFFSIVGLCCKVNAENFAVLEVDPNGSAYKKGIREKDILTKINGQDVSSLSSIVEITELVSELSVPKNGEFTFTFKQGDEMITVTSSKRDTDASKN